MRAAALHFIETRIAQQDLAVFDARFAQRAPFRSGRAAHFEHIVEIGRKRYRERHGSGLRAVIRQHDRFVQHVARQHAAALDVDHALWRRRAPIGGSGRLVRWAVKTALSLDTLPDSSDGARPPKVRYNWESTRVS